MAQPDKTWQELLSELRAYLRTCMTDGYHLEQVIALTMGIERKFARELAGQIEEPRNYMAPAPPPGIIERPDPLCSECGMALQIKKVGTREFVVDHGEAVSDCPNACKMWKISVERIAYNEQVYVPPFVREAMKKG